jgi:predicted acylesterase/phospholipase RssA
VITSYDMAYDEPILFSSRPMAAAISHVSMVEVARATSAGPTYFEPQVLATTEKERALVDGGVYINNPAILGFVLAPVDQPLVLVSLGTGTRNSSSPRPFSDVKTASWLSIAQQVMEAAMTGGGEVADTLLHTLTETRGRTHRYWRMQTTVGDCNFAMDDSSAANIACLATVAERLVQERADDLDEIATVISAR